MNDKELMQQALEALTAYDGTNNASQRKRVLAALRERLAQPEQEPVWIQPNHLQKARQAPFLCRVEPAKRDDFVPLYTTSPQRQWQGLTDEERNNLWRKVVGWGDPSHDDEDLMKAIEAKLKEKNT